MTLITRIHIATFSVFATFVMFFYFGATQAAASVTDSLVGHWALNEGAGSTAVDSISGNNGAWQGTAPHYVSDGPLSISTSGVFSFDDGQYVIIPNAPAYTFSTYFSTSLWIKATAWNPWNALLAKDVWDTQEGWAIYVNDQAGGLGSLCYEAPVHGTICTDHIIPLSTWVHIVVTNDNGTASIYVDGVQEETGSVPVANSSVDLYIGARHQNDGTSVNDNFIGSISDVRLYSRLLNSDDIEILYTGSSPSSSSSSSSSSSERRQSNGGHRGSRTPASYQVDLQSHEYAMASSASSVLSSVHPAAALVSVTSTAQHQGTVARVCARLSNRNFSEGILQRINQRLFKRFGSSCDR